MQLELMNNLNLGINYRIYPNGWARIDRRNSGLLIIVMALKL
jgi:hypothetical protein